MKNLYKTFTSILAHILFTIVVGYGAMYSYASEGSMNVAAFILGLYTGLSLIAYVGWLVGEKAPNYSPGWLGRVKRSTQGVLVMSWTVMAVWAGWFWIASSLVLMLLLTSAVARKFKVKLQEAQQQPSF